MTSNPFVHLHVHTEYSLLDGAAKIKDLIQKAKNDNQPALGITDHGNMYGLIEFYKSCKKESIKPILGIEAYMAKDSVSDRPKRRSRVTDDSGGTTQAGEKLYYHLTLLAKNNTGYKNLIKLSSKAFLEGYYYKPRVDWDILEAHSEGIIATTGCLGGQVNQALLAGNYDLALNKASRLQDIFGKENLYVELQDHNLEEQAKNMNDLIKISKDLNAPLLATNDCHYTDKKHAKAHDALLCIQTGSMISETDRFKFEGEEHYLKTSQEMRDVFKEMEEACDNTLQIEEMCNVEIDFGKPSLPNFKIPTKFKNEAEYLKTLVFNGAKKRWGNVDDVIKNRLKHELEIIGSMGFDSYFLITWDLVKFARSQNIRVGPGRGSAAGCCVAYCLGITEIDPIKYKLLFSRFLNISRKQLPDIDLDFDSRYRDDLMRYLSNKYGEKHVAQIITFSKLKARAAVRDVTRVMGHSYSIGDNIVKAMPPMVAGRTASIRECLEGDLRGIYGKNQEETKILDISLELEDLCRQDSVHAAAVVISKKELTDIIPIQRKGEDSPIVTQYEMHAVEELGLLKMDLLGLRNLDVISETVEMIEANIDKDFKIEKIPLDDKKTFDMLKDGKSNGVFQLESETMKSLMVSLSPDSFDDIAALVAIHRPGPMDAGVHNDFANRKNGRSKIEYIHEDAKEILEDTYGLMIYQESMMLLAEKFAGFTEVEAEELRKACGKKIRSIMAEQKQKFINGCGATISSSTNKPYGKDLGKTIWDQIEPFADYAFNKSHSYGYGLLSYQTAYLKANYSTIYMTALLNSVKNNPEKLSFYLAECISMNIEILLPDINISMSDFTVVDKNSISFGLSGIKGVGESVAELIIEERNSGGNFKSFIDFCNRISPSCLNKNKLESLIFTGSFDSFKNTRKELIKNYPEVVKKSKIKNKETSKGNVSLFDDDIDEIIIIQNSNEEEFSKKEILKKEKELLGWYVSGHPMSQIQPKIKEFVEHSLKEFLNIENDSSRKQICAVASSISPWRTKRGQHMARIKIEDLEISSEAIIFPSQWHELSKKIEEGKIYIFTVELKREHDSQTLIISRAKPIEDI